METNPYERSTEVEARAKQVKRNMFARIAFSVLWLLLIVISIEFVVAMIHVTMNSTTDGLNTLEEGVAAGYDAGMAAESKYWGVSLLGEFLVWLVLSVLGKLPGTTKFKHVSV